jgi:crotonobetainyl-CoA:carnitine CoA-transferase CaiB-like acyl-CoA transferase
MMPIGKVASLVGIPGFENDDSRNVVENRDEVKRRMEPGFAKRSTAELMEIFMGADIWAAPVNDFPAVARDQQVQHNQIITSFDHPRAGRFRTVGPPIRFSRTPGVVQRPPLLGEHTGEILHELGYEPEQIAQFKRDKVV